MTALVEGAADRAIDKKLKEIRGTGTQRTQGRNTFPKALADFFFNMPGENK